MIGSLVTRLQERLCQNAVLNPQHTFQCLLAYIALEIMYILLLMSVILLIAGYIIQILFRANLI